MGQQPPKNIYSVPAQEIAKHRAKFAWPPMSEVAAVTKPRRRNPLKSAGVPQTNEPISALVARAEVHHIVNTYGEILLFKGRHGVVCR